MQTQENQLWVTLTQRLKARHFSLLSSIYRHRSLRKVAQEMNLSQPAITKALKEMEEILQTRLFERTARGLVPTSAAALMVVRGGAFLEDLRNLARDLISLKSGYHGVLKIGVIHFISYTLLTKAMEVLRLQGFDYRFIVRDGNTEGLIDLLRGRELDCVIGRLSHEHSNELSQEVLYTQQAALLASSEYRVPKVKQLTIGVLEGAHWLLPPRATPTRRAVEEMFIRRGVVVPEPLMETSSVEVLKVVLAADPKSVTILPSDLAEEISKDAAYKRLPLELDFALPAVSLITRRESRQEKSVDTLLQAIRAAAR